MLSNQTALKLPAMYVALARAQPGKLNYLNPAVGSASHLNTELLKIKEKINLVSVPYNGQPPGMVDLLSGRLQFALLAPQVAMPQITAGKLKPIAVAFPKRLPELPDVPTHVRRSGLSGSERGRVVLDPGAEADVARGRFQNRRGGAQGVDRPGGAQRL